MEAEHGGNHFSLHKARERMSIMCPNGADIVSLSFSKRRSASFTPALHLPPSSLLVIEHLKSILLLGSPRYHPQIQPNFSLSLDKTKDFLLLIVPSCHRGEGGEERRRGEELRRGVEHKA